MIKHSLFIITLLSGVSVFGQEVISSSGQTHSSGQLIVSQTIGETVVGTISNGTIANQGFHQSETVITGIYERDESLELTVYPNPFAERLVISSEVELGSITVYNILGIAVYERLIQKGQTSVELQLSDLTAGQYLIRVTSVNRPKSSTYSIIKQ